MADDAAHMGEAVELAQRAYPAPNPRVGAVVVREGEVIGRGFHFGVGHPHAEAVALREAGKAARGATMYVNLEPCNHHGRTPPCSQEIVHAGVVRVVYAVADPNLQAAGGAEALRAAGVAVVAGVREDEAARLNRPFLHRWRTGRPYVLVKAAMTLDGRIADAFGSSKWVTGPGARRRAHELRAEMGCVLVGAGTVRCDDPALTVREFEVARQPLRVILGSVDHGRQVLDDAAETVVIAGAEGSDLESVLKQIAERGEIGVLVEGGGRTIESFLRANLVDEIELHMAPKALGAGPAWAEGAGVPLPEAWQFADIRCEPLGDGLRINAFPSQQS